MMEFSHHVTPSVVTEKRSKRVPLQGRFTRASDQNNVTYKTPMGPINFLYLLRWSVWYRTMVGTIPDVLWYLVWYGMVWYGMVYGMVWYGMVWYGMVWCMVTRTIPLP